MSNVSTLEARRLLDNLRNGTFDPAELDPEFEKRMGKRRWVSLDDFLKGGSAHARALGDLISFREAATVATPEGPAFVFHVDFSSESRLTWIVSRNAAGTIDRLVLQRHAHDRIFSMQVHGRQIEA